MPRPRRVVAVGTIAFVRIVFPGDRVEREGDGVVGPAIIGRVLLAVLCRFIGTTTYLVLSARHAPYRALVRGLVKLLIVMRRDLL